MVRFYTLIALLLQGTNAQLGLSIVPSPDRVIAYINNNIAIQKFEVSLCLIKWPRNLRLVPKFLRLDQMIPMQFTPGLLPQHIQLRPGNIMKPVSLKLLMDMLLNVLGHLTFLGQKQLK